jgi:hypothetical protein
VPIVGPRGAIRESLAIPIGIDRRTPHGTRRAPTIVPRRVIRESSALDAARITAPGLIPTGPIPTGLIPSRLNLAIPDLTDRGLAKSE